MSGQVRPEAGASSPHTYFKQHVHENSAMLSYFYVKKRLKNKNPHKLCFIYEINQANKKQGLALQRLENGEIATFFTRK